MDKQHQELQFLGFFGILKESFKIIFSQTKIFTQITLAVILPLSFIVQAHNYLSRKISSQHLAYQILFKFSYFSFLLVPSVLSTSAVGCVITYIYTSKDVTKKKVMGMLPKIWKRVMITCALGFAIDYCYINLLGRFGINLISDFFLAEFEATKTFTTTTIIGSILVFAYIAGNVYIHIICHLATVVSVIEDVSGLKAMMKSKNLIHSKMGVAVAMFLVFTFGLSEIDRRIYKSFVAPDRPLSWRNGVGIGIPCLMLLHSMAILLVLVVQTVMYFVCKSHEITMKVMASHSHQTSFKSIWWNVFP